MINIPLTVIIAIIGMLITSRFQRYHWLRSTREEIRVRETTEASELVRDIARTFDKRITAQRSFLLNPPSPDADKSQEAFENAIKEYSEDFNEIRYRSFYYYSYQRVLDFEKDFHERIVDNAMETRYISRHGKPRSRSIAELDKDLSVLSAKVYEYCTKLSNEIAEEKIGELNRIYNWKDPTNEFITNWHLIRRLLNF